MRDYALIGCGHCGQGILAQDAPACPVQPHRLCSACAASVTALVTTLHAQGDDPGATRRRRRRRKPANAGTA